MKSSSKLECQCARSRMVMNMTDNTVHSFKTQTPANYCLNISNYWCTARVRRAQNSTLLPPIPRDFIGYVMCLAVLIIGSITNHTWGYHQRYETDRKEQNRSNCRNSGSTPLGGFTYWKKYITHRFVTLRCVLGTRACIK